ncbi:MAG: hypothetical protein HQL52_12640 [Magnetococcales bacterium]|nr:hypothetical protein [Magnetococcales bacterium]
MMLVIGILVSLGLSRIGPAVIKAKTAEAEQVVAAALLGVVGYAAENERLPDVVGTGTTGFDAIVPRADDPFNRPLLYVVDNSILTSTHSLCDENGTSTGFEVALCDDDACSTTTTVTEIAFMIWSVGADATQQLRSVGSTRLSDPDVTTTIDLITRADGGDVADFSPPQITVPRPGDTRLVEGGLPFDDIVRWVTLGELKQKIGCGAGGMGTPLKIVNTSLPAGKVSSPYRATLLGDGGIVATTGQYRWCYEVTGILGGVDLYLDAALTQPLAPSGDCGEVAEEDWGRSDAGNPSHLYLDDNGSAITARSGTYLYRIFLRDEGDPGTTTGVNGGDRIVVKSFVITVDP